MSAPPIDHQSIAGKRYAFEIATGWEPFCDRAGQMIKGIVVQVFKREGDDEVRIDLVNPFDRGIHVTLCIAE